MKDLFIELINGTLLSYDNIDVKITYSTCSAETCVTVFKKYKKGKAGKNCTFYFYHHIDKEMLKQKQTKLFELLSDEKVTYKTIVNYNKLVG